VNDLPLVSVVTRTKDRLDFLAEAAASVSAQTYPNVEHVVVNDGGADPTAVLAPFAKKRPVVVVSEGNVGRCKAGNLGLKAAKGEWIAWLDDDDLYRPEHVETLVAFAKERGKKVVYSMAEIIRQSLDPKTGLYRDVSREPAPSTEFSRLALWTFGNIHLVTILHHRSLYEDHGGFDEGLDVLEDLDLFARFAQDEDFARCPKITAAYRVRDDRTNAVTAMRKEFAETRRLLVGRYAHIALNEIIGMVEHGKTVLGDAVERIAKLEAEVRRLKEGRP
jgi:glycosyltransferase involved in cell wall biosynthesis